MFGKELMNITLNDARFPSSKLTDDQNLEQVLLAISSSTTTTRCLQN